MQLSEIQLTFVENLTPLALSVPEILALQHGAAEDAVKNGPKKSEKIQISFNVPKRRPIVAKFGTSVDDGKTQLFHVQIFDNCPQKILAPL